MAGWGRASGRERWLLCPAEKGQEAWCCRQGMVSQSLGHEQRVSSTSGLITVSPWAVSWCCVHTEPR